MRARLDFDTFPGPNGGDPLKGGSRAGGPEDVVVIEMFTCFPRGGLLARLQGTGF